MTMQNKLFSTNELEQYLNVPRSWVYRQCFEPDGLLKPALVKVGKYSRFKKDVIDELFGLGESGDDDAKR